MKKLFVTGLSSHLGYEILRVDQKQWSIFGTYNQNKITWNQEQSFQVDFKEKSIFKKLFTKIKPDACLHLAAITDAGFCENNITSSLEMNVDGTEMLTLLCKDNKIPLIFTSTDLVFSGNEAPYEEMCPPNPVCVYGQHKTIAEKIVLEYKYGMVCRLPLMLGVVPFKTNFIYNCITKLKQKQQVPLFIDEFRTPTGTRSVAKILLQLLNNFTPSIYHLGGNERLSRYELGLRICQQSQLDSRYIKKCRQQDVKMPFKRPKDVSLVNTKIKKRGYDFFSLDDEIQYILESLDI